MEWQGQVGRLFAIVVEYIYPTRCSIGCRPNTISIKRCLLAVESIVHQPRRHSSRTIAARQILVNADCFTWHPFQRQSPRHSDDRSRRADTPRSTWSGRWRIWPENAANILYSQFKSLV